MLRWLPLATACALTPKCLLCLAAYAGVGATLGVSVFGPEWCGAPVAGETIVWLAAWAGATGLAVGVRLIGRRSEGRRTRWAR